MVSRTFGTSASNSSVTPMNPPAHPGRSRIRRGDSHNTSLGFVNDDAAEKEHRRHSNTGASRRESLVAAARGISASDKTAPVLANFEQWMKLVKDNKINATNSWNFALIDYFHDMSLLKDGDGINFQKASYTLDGCVKIYTSRIDSVANETGKLLSGLADSDKNKKKRAGDDDDDDGLDDDDDDEGDDGAEGDGAVGEDGQPTKKKTSKSSRKKAESTLAKDFAALQVKKLDLELSIDPLFRKMCADFDEGGSKGLLLNSLIIDNNGRIVFDGEMHRGPNGVDLGNGVKPLFVDEPNDVDEDMDEDMAEDDEEEDDEEENPDSDAVAVDIDDLRAKFFPDIQDLGGIEVCPSVYNIDAALKDPSLLSSAFQEELEKREGERSRSVGLGDDIEVDSEGNVQSLGSDVNDYEEGGYGLNMDDYDDGPMLDYDDDGARIDITYNTGAAGGDASNSGNTFYTSGGQAGAFLLNSVGNDRDILSYFDETLKKNWAGPEYWKIQRLKQKEGALNNSSNSADGGNTDAAGTGSKKKTQKEPFVIDFLSDENDLLETDVFAQGSASINLSKVQQKATNPNLLPDDQHFSSQNLIKLFLKPKGRVFNRLFGRPNDSEGGDAEDGYENNNGHASGEGNYDANFFQDDGDDYGGLLGGGDDDDDYGGLLGGGGDDDIGVNGNDSGNYDEKVPGIADVIGSKARPDYVNYARTAKRVNVKLLKNNLWKSMSMDEGSRDTTEEKTFTDVVQDLKNLYPEQHLSQISTSFCFICALHLANEKGLIIEDNEEHDELKIRWDPSATAAVE